MIKPKFLDFLKFFLIKTLITSILFISFDSQGYEGNQETIIYTIFIGTITLIIFYLIILLVQKSGYNYGRYYFIFSLLIINELSGIIVSYETNIFEVIMTRQNWLILFKLFDNISLIISAYLCFILPYKRAPN